MSSDIRSYDYVNHAYDDVRAVLCADPIGLFTHATSVGATEACEAIAQVHVKLGAVDIAAPVAITVGDVREVVKYGRCATAVSLTWAHAERPGLFPAMTAVLSIYALSPSETQLELDGRYEPPFGLLGAAVDSVIGHRLARIAIHGFIQDVALRMRAAEPIRISTTG